MKKVYSKPTNEVFNVESSAPLVESPNCVQSGGSNANGGPTSAEVQEWRNTDVMNDEW